MKQDEIDALIKLLDDTDYEVYSHIEERLLSLGKDVIPLLEDAWSNSLDALLQQRIEYVIHKIQFESLKEDLKIWAVTDGKDLIRASIIVSRYQYPDLNEEKLRKQIDQIKRDVWIELSDRLTALEQVRVLNHVFFELYEFKGNTTNFHAPQNSFLNQVLESKKGNPLLLAILYSEVAKSLNIPIYGVNLPEHFVLAYLDSNNVIPLEDEKIHSRILFYINPFSRGSIFSRKEIDAFLKQIKVTPDEIYYQPCIPVEVIKRMLRNLMYSYEKLGHSDKVEELTLLLEAISE